MNVSIVALLLLGALLLLNVNPFSVVRELHLVKRLRQLLADFEQERQTKKKRTLKQRIDKIQGRTKESFFIKNLSQARRILTATNQKNKIKTLNTLCAVGFLAGAAISLLAQNILLLPVLSVGLTLVPMWYIKYNEFHYLKQLSSELEVALSVITSSYLRTSNLIGAVEENIHYIDRPVRDVFQSFLSEVKYISANVPDAIEKMKNSFSNSVFREWCDTILLCQSDRELRHSLQPIVDEFRDNKNLQQSMESIILMPVKNFRTLIYLAVSIIPIFYFTSREWFAVLVGTAIGKGLIAAMSAAVFYGMNKAVNLSQPIN